MTKTLSLLSIVLAIVGVAAQGQTDTPLLAGIAHVAIRVSDLNRSRDFYQKLGFEQAFTFTKDGVVTESFLKVNDQQFIEMYPQQQPSQSIGFMHVCFEGADLEVLHREYVARGLSPTPVKRAGAGNLLFTMEGPEKQNIEYTQYMPGSKHTNDIGMHLGADRISKQIAGLGIEMQDPAGAKTFYDKKLGFRSARRPFETGFITLDLPGGSGQQIEFVPRASGPAFRLLLSVPDLSRAAAQLK